MKAGFPREASALRSRTPPDANTYSTKTRAAHPQMAMEVVLIDDSRMTAACLNPCGLIKGDRG